MTILGFSDAFLIESDRAPGHGWMVSVVRPDGCAVALYGADIVSRTRQAIEQYGVDRTARTYAKANRDEWKQTYKPHKARQMFANLKARGTTD